MSQHRHVILVNPRMCSPRSARLPLSLLSLAAVLDGRYRYTIVDGNLSTRFVDTVLRTVQTEKKTALAVTVMPGPQVAPAIEISRAVRKRDPSVPIIWGGYFPTLYPDAAINAPYVDFVVRGQGEETLLEILDRLQSTEVAANPSSDSVADPTTVAGISGITWKRDQTPVHEVERAFRPPDTFPPLPYEAVPNVERYFQPSFLGRRTAVHQAAIGCRYRCSFCGVVSMFNGKTILQGVERLASVMTTLRDRYGADAMQFYDHNFFDREETSVPILEVLARFGLPWWCYARADTLANFSSATWELIRQSRLRMAYIGAEAGTDEALRRMHKGSRVEHTFEVARRCRAYGVTPEFSFVLGGPEDPEGEIEKTFSFIRTLKKIHPECEVILYFYSPTPQRDPAWIRREQQRADLPRLDRYGPDGPSLPTTPEEWTEPRWIDFVSHQDAPWLTPKIRRRVKDFAKVLYCRFPTVQDYSTPQWAKRILGNLAAWRYATGRYDNPWELDLAKRVIRIREPQRVSI